MRRTRAELEKDLVDGHKEWIRHAEELGNKIREANELRERLNFTKGRFLTESTHVGRLIELLDRVIPKPDRGGVSSMPQDSSGPIAWRPEGPEKGWRHLESDRSLAGEADAMLEKSRASLSRFRNDQTAFKRKSIRMGKKR